MPTPDTQDSPTPPAGHRAIALVACAGMLLLFVLLADRAVATKSPTFDEPVHVVGSWLHLYTRDFRINTDHPPLWHYWAALPHGPTALDPRMDQPLFKSIGLDRSGKWRYAVEVLYRTEGNDAQALVRRSRRMMVLLGLVLGAVVAWWSWTLGGLAAAIAATSAFALDPNFLGHAPLVKNDVALVLTMLLVTIAVWRAGRRLTAWNALAVGAYCAVAMNVKFSALLFAPMVLILMLTRAWMQHPWPAFGRLMTTTASRMAMALGVVAGAALISYLGIWGTYGFRYHPTPEHDLLLDTRQVVQAFRANDRTWTEDPPLISGRTDAGALNPFVRAGLLAEKHQLLPQAWLNGLLYTYGSVLRRDAFLLGNYSTTGWWYYFPFAMLVKTPLALLFAAAGALILAATALRRHAEPWQPEQRWTMACLAVPAGIYMLSAMSSNLNLGIRHLLPVYPFLYVILGLGAAHAWVRWRKIAVIAGTILLTGLAAETLAAYPNYIAFFNIAAGGSRGGIHLLSDSNLDWGQDLELLARWQKDHPELPLSLCYFGMADPSYYGIRYTNLPGCYPYGPRPGAPRIPGVIAISATHLQGTYLDERNRLLYRRIWKDVRPIDVLGGTIYLYDAQDLLGLTDRSPNDIQQGGQPPSSRVP